jgi:hypothetical protein
MTMQIPDILLIDGQSYPTEDEPLNLLPPTWNSLEAPNAVNPKPLLGPASTACWRGYQATWLVQNSILWLVEFKARDWDFKDIGMKEVFYVPQLPAFWFTGDIRCGDGECVAYNHMRFHERTLLFRFRRGVLIDRVTVNNPIEEYRAKKKQF